MFCGSLNGDLGFVELQRLAQGVQIGLEVLDELRVKRVGDIQSLVLHTPVSQVFLHLIDREHGPGNSETPGTIEASDCSLTRAPKLDGNSSVDCGKYLVDICQESLIILDLP
jgi:hypothetical protein